MDTYIPSASLTCVTLAVVLRVLVLRLLGLGVNTFASDVRFYVGVTYSLFLSHCFRFNLLGRWDLNPRLPVYKTDALTN